MKLDTSKKPQVTPQSMAHTTQKAKIDTSMSDLIMDMLSKIYSAPLTAAIREYVSNGVDSHQAAGQTRPVEVTLPTYDSPMLKVRDFGRGMDMFDILTIYGNFGTSDKRDSDDFIGGFGIGSKSGLAVSDIIDVESVKNGTYNHFRIKRQNKEIITQFIVENEPAGNRENGTTVNVYVNQNYLRDISDGMANIQPEHNRQLSQYMQTLSGWSKSKVIAKCANPAVAQFCNEYRIPDTYVEYPHGYLANDTLTKHACSGFLVGDVFYPANSEGQNILDIHDNTGKTPTGFRSQIRVVKLEIGSTKVAYSREQIEYNGSDKTQKHVRAQIEGLAQDVADFVDKLQNVQGLSQDDYIKRIIAAGINPLASGMYGRSIRTSKNNKFNLDGNVDVDLNSACSLELSPNRDMSDVTVSKDTFDNHDMAPDAVYDKLVFVVDDAEKFKAPGTYNRYIKEALTAYAQEKNLYPDSTLDAVQQHMATHPGSWRHGTLAYIMKQCELQKYPFRSFANSLPMQDLIDYTQASRQRARVSNNNAVIKKAKVYALNCHSHYNSAELIELDDLLSRDTFDETHTIVIDPKHPLAFNTQTGNDMHKILAHMLHMDIICTRTLSDVNVLKKRIPNAWYATYDEIKDAAEQIVKGYAWIARDPFCITIDGCICNIAYRDPGSDRTDIMNLADTVDTYMEHVRKCPNNPLGLQQTLDRIENAKDSYPLMKELYDLSVKTDGAGPAHKTTYAYRLVMTILNANSRTMLTKAEVTALIDQMRQDYQYEINQLKALY